MDEDHFVVEVTERGQEFRVGELEGGLPWRLSFLPWTNVAAEMRTRSQGGAPKEAIWCPETVG